jgi:hypothetical protein
MDDATPNNGTVVFVDPAGIRRSLDILSAPFGLAASEVRDTAIAVDILDDAGKTTGVRFHVMHPVLSMESGILDDRRLPKAFREKRDPTLTHEVGPPRDRGRGGGPER